MDFHEKSLELNVTHELLNLTDSWWWFLTDIPLWRYWRPRFRLPFIPAPKSVSAGLHINTEGKPDSSGKSGGGFDVRIKAGVGGHLLFIQYKKGKLVTGSPHKKSIFNNPAKENFAFKVNNKSTNQHFTLRELADGIGSEKGNAVVYGFPLIADMDELEKNAGRLIRKTKFISVSDLDAQAIKDGVPFKQDVEHHFRIDKLDMSKCEMNLLLLFFTGTDRTPDIIADAVAIGFQKALKTYLAQAPTAFEQYGLNVDYIPFGLQQAFIQYMRYLHHYFEVAPSRYKLAREEEYYDENEFEGYKNDLRDIEILQAVRNALLKFEDFIFSFKEGIGKIGLAEIPTYLPRIFIDSNDLLDRRLTFSNRRSRAAIEDMTYLTI